MSRSNRITHDFISRSYNFYPETDLNCIMSTINECLRVYHPLYIHLRITKMKQSTWHIKNKYKAKITYGKWQCKVNSQL